MKKTISISLGRQSFQVEDDAYEKLERYLQEVKSHFSGNAEKDEILGDIETRFAEQLTVKGAHARTVTLQDVTELISSMGTPEQMKGEETSTNTKQEEQGGFDRTDKKFFRDPDDQILAGVAGGLASYFHIDPVLVRIAFFVSIFLGGFGIALYLVLWLITPEAKTEMQKSQMRGEKVDLKSIEQTIRKRVEELKKKDYSQVKSALQSTGEVVAKSGNRLGEFVKGLFLVLAKALGLVLVIAGALAIAGVIFAITAVAFNTNSPYLAFPLQELAGHPWYYPGLVAGFFTVFVPLSFLLTLGSSLLAGKSKFTPFGSLALLGIWVVALAVVSSAGLRLAPEIERLRETSPSSQLETRQVSLQDFTGVKLTGAQTAELAMGEEYGVLISGSKQSLDEMHAYVDSQGNLVADSKQRFQICIFYCWNEPLHLKVTAPRLHNIALSGASKVEGVVQTGSEENLYLKLSGASKATLDSVAEKARLELSGASQLSLKGRIPQLQADLSGASRLETGELQTAEVEANLSGASRANFASLDTLKAKLSGGSKLTYVEVRELEQTLSGGSKVEQVNKDGSLTH